jgi:hypothetical protein
MMNHPVAHLIAAVGLFWSSMALALDTTPAAQALHEVLSAHVCSTRQ